MSAGQPAFPLIRRPQTRPGGAFTIPQYQNIIRKHKKERNKTISEIIPSV